MNLLWTALVMGLASSAHCLLMCGPLALGMTNAGSGNSIAKPLLYHSGRLTAYAGIGLLFGLLSEAISLIPYQQAISLAAGVLLLFGAVLTFFSGSRGRVLRVWRSISSGMFSRIRSLPKNASLFSLGILNGFLPCGMVYLAAIASLHAGKAEYSVAYMLLFGAGTLPVMLGITYAAKFIQARWRSLFSKAVPYMAIAMAILFILRGLSLNIPYLSPKITLTEKNKVESCCVKNGNHTLKR